MDEYNSYSGERTTLWRRVTPLGQAIGLVTGRRWEPSPEEQKCIDSLFSNDVYGEDKCSPQVVISWNGDNDSENPQNWPRAYKLWVTFLISLYSFIVYGASAIVVPSYEAMMVRFDFSREVVSLVLSIYVLGYGVGPLIFSPLSEIAAIGRNPPYIISFILFVVISIVLSVVDNFPAIVVLRFFQGVFGSPCLATGGASIQDVYSLKAVPYGFIAWIACIYSGPALGPLLASRAVETLNWHWPLWEVAIMGAPSLLFMALLLPETSANTILFRRARRLRHLTGNSNIFAPSQLQHASLFSHVAETLFRPIEIAIKDPAIAFVCVYCSFIYAVYYSFFEAFPLVYRVVYAMAPVPFSTIFLSIVAGCTIAVTIYILYIRFMAESLETLIAENKHEKALLPALPAVCLAPMGLFLFAWTARESIHWIVPTIGIAIYAGATFVIYQAVLIYIPQSYPQYVASLLAASDFTRSATAAVFIMVSPYMYQNLGISKGVTLLACISVLGIVGIVVLWRYGRYLRARSKFAVD